MAVACHTVHHTHVNVSFARIYSTLRATFLYDQTEYLMRHWIHADVSLLGTTIKTQAFVTRQ
jgi:hypothetical protein